MTDGKHVIVNIRDVARSFGSGHARVDALRGVDLDVRAGEFVAVMGPSGSGKSTLLHLVGGLDTPTRGEVMVEGQRLADLNDDALTQLRRRRIGFVFQAFNLIRVLTAAENVAVPLELDGVNEHAARRRAVAALELAGLGERVDHYPGELSGGEQQRVAIARALVNEPVLLLADEPTGNLDTATSDRVMGLLRRIVDDHGQTILIVTHNARHASMADRIVYLRDGRIADEQVLTAQRSPAQILADLEAMS